MPLTRIGDRLALSTCMYICCFCAVCYTQQWGAQWGTYTAHLTVCNSCIGLLMFSFNEACRLLIWTLANQNHHRVYLYMFDSSYASSLKLFIPPITQQNINTTSTCPLVCTHWLFLAQIHMLSLQLLDQHTCSRFLIQQFFLLISSCTWKQVPHNLHSRFCCSNVHVTNMLHLTAYFSHVVQLEMPTGIHVVLGNNNGQGWCDAGEHNNGWSRPMKRTRFCKSYFRITCMLERF